MKNVLFIGDLRTAFNYGAIATTETLISLIKNERYDINIKYIDYRSLYHPTPLAGYPPITYTPQKITFVKKIKSYIPRSAKTYIKNILKPIKQCDFVPYKYSQYESYFKQMEAGKILQFEKKMLEWADIIYINGEGNIVNGTDQYGKYRMGARYILFMAWVSKIKYNKTTLMVNHTVDPNNSNAFEMISHIYPHLDEVYVREPLSLPILEKYKINNGKFVPDALWAYKPSKHWEIPDILKKEIDFSKPYICIGDSSGFRNAYNKVKWDVPSVMGKIIDELHKITSQIIFVDGFSGGNDDITQIIKKKKLGYVNLNNCSYHDLYHVLERSQIFISGRWHASILCILANTPILLWGSDSHKTKSLYTILDYPYPFFEVSTLPVNIEELTDTVKKIIGNQELIKADIQAKSILLSEKAIQNAKILSKYVN